MSDIDKNFTGSIPEFYDTYLVPLIFESYASQLAKSVASNRPTSVLETAAGSGVVTRQLAQLLPRQASYLVTDLNQPMLDYAALRQTSNSNISWQQADALNLPFEDDQFDAVCCQFGVMFFPDKVKAYKEAKRVLKTGGQLAFNTWASIEDNVFAHIVTKAAAEIFPNDPPLFMARTPHGYHDLDLICSELSSVGFTNIEVITTSGTSDAPSARHPALAYCQGTPLRNEIEARDASRLDEVTDHAARAIEREYGKGPVSAKIKGHLITAMA